KKAAYNEESRLCLDCKVSLTQGQYRMESTLKTPGQEAPLVKSFLGDTDDFPSRARHLINREDSYLGGWLSVIDAFPSREISELPFFGALQWPAYSHDCLVQLGVMGLVEAGKDMTGFKLTRKGTDVMPFYKSEFLTRLDLSTLLALVDISNLGDENIKRSAIRMVLFLEHCHVIVKEATEQANRSVKDFILALEDIANSKNGGPGRKYVHRGSLWAAWVVLEDATRSSNKPRPSEFAPKTDQPPFVLDANAFGDYTEDVAFWEKNLGLKPLPKSGWGGFQLADSEADAIQNLMVRSYYPFLMEIPLQLRSMYKEGVRLDTGLYRTKSAAFRSKPMQTLFQEVWAETLRNNAPSRSSILCAGLPAPPLTLNSDESEVIAEAVMIMPHDTVSSLDQGSLDKLARDNDTL
ncbi:hypothetical protein Daus18300_013822, partial [Diaporthe australafricana]